MLDWALPKKKKKESFASQTPFCKVPVLQLFPSLLPTCSVDKLKKESFCRSVFFNVKKMPKLTVPQVEVVGGPGGPQPHGVHGVVHVAGDGRVVRHRQNHLQCKQWVSRKTQQRNVKTEEGQQRSYWHTMRGNLNPLNLFFSRFASHCSTFCHFFNSFA